MKETHFCSGFSFAGIAAGLKKNDAKDLGLIYSQVPATVAGVFTRNKVKAATVILGKKRIQSGTCQAVIVNSGNANCCTGPKGILDAENMGAAVAAQLGVGDDFVQVASTGVIGLPLPLSRIQKAIPSLVEALNPRGTMDFAQAIMTTDTVPKTASLSAEIDAKTYTIWGVAKGAGMIRPDMATMLCFVVTDLSVPREVLQTALLRATECTFNRITIDGDTSTNDTVLLLANGLSGVKIKSSEQISLFQDQIQEILLRLARQIVKDGEGVTKMVNIQVNGAKTDDDARQVADTIAHSSLVKTALFGQDANWGRILAAAGRAGVSLEPDRLSLYFNDVLMVKKGLGMGQAAEAEATRVLKQPEFTLLLDLNMGEGRAFILSCDLSIEYVKINADYRS